MNDNSNQSDSKKSKCLEDYNNNWKEFVRFEFLLPALEYIEYEEFWNLTPVSLNDIIQARINKQRKDIELQMEVQDVLNWQLGQYINRAFADVYNKAWGKGSDVYPKKPLFSGDIKNNNNELDEAQKELETLKFKNFFNNLGSYVKIKDKGGK